MSNLQNYIRINEDESENNNIYEKKINVNNTTTILSKPLPVDSKNNTTSRTNNIILLTKFCH